MFKHLAILAILFVAFSCAENNEIIPTPNQEVPQLPNFSEVFNAKVFDVTAFTPIEDSAKSSNSVSSKIDQFFLENNVEREDIGYPAYGAAQITNGLVIVPLLEPGLKASRACLVGQENSGEISNLSYLSVLKSSHPFELSSLLTTLMMTPEAKENANFTGEIVSTESKSKDSNLTAKGCTNFIVREYHCTRVTVGGEVVREECELVGVTFDTECDNAPGTGGDSNSGGDNGNDTGDSNTGGSNGSDGNDGNIGTDSPIVIIENPTISGLCWDEGDITNLRGDQSEPGQTGGGAYVRFSNFSHEFRHTRLGVTVTMNISSLCIQTTGYDLNSATAFNIDLAIAEAIRLTEVNLNTFFGNTPVPSWQIQATFKTILEGNLNLQYGFNSATSVNTSPNGCPGIPFTPTVWGC